MSLSREERYAVERELAKQFEDLDETPSVLDSTVMIKLQEGGEGDDRHQQQQQHESDSHLVFGEVQVGEASFGSPTSSLSPSSSIASLSNLNQTQLNAESSSSPSRPVAASQKHRIQTEPRERRTAPRLTLSPLESTPIPLEIDEWHYALASIANEKQADEAAALGATSASAALAQRKAEVLLVKAATERNAAASLRVAHERNIASLLFDSIPQHIAAATTASASGNIKSNIQGSNRGSAESSNVSASGNSGTVSNVQLPVKRSSLSPAVARAVFLPLCPTAAPEYDPISLKADLAFVKHMTRLGREDPDAVQRLLRRHLFLCCRLFKGDPWLPSATMDKKEVSFAPAAGSISKPSYQQTVSPVDAALEISRVVGSHSVGSKSAAFRALFRKMYADAMLTTTTTTTTNLASSENTSPPPPPPPIVPRSTLEAAVCDLNSYAVLLARGLLLKYPFLSSLQMVSNPLRLEPKTPMASAPTPRISSTPFEPSSSQSPQKHQKQGQRSGIEQQQYSNISRPQDPQPLVRKSSSFLSLLASTAPALFGPLPALPPAGGSSGEGGFTSTASPSQLRRQSSQSQQVLPSLKPVDLGPSLLRCTQEALHILCNDTLFGVVLAHTRLQDEDAAPFLWKMSSQPPCAFGLSHAFCGPNEIGCTKSKTSEEIDHLGGAETSSTTIINTAADKGDECYSAAIECLQFLQQQRSPLTKLGALRNCLKAITFSAGIEERLLLSATAAASASVVSGDQQSSKQNESMSSSIGADDLMPRICFVMARAFRRTSSGSASSSLSGAQYVFSLLRMRPFAELCFLEECMPQEKLLGEDGYTLVSVRGALMHVVMLGKSLP